MVHALVHLLIDVLDGVPGGSLERWRKIAQTVPSDNMRATNAWVEAIAGDRTAAGEILDRAPSGATAVRTDPRHHYGQSAR